MQIAVASGKGGTGKTTVSVNLSHYIPEFIDKRVQLIDCDVEEPNTVLFFHEPIRLSTNQVFQYIPEINPQTCTFCKRCADWCTFNAISIVAAQKFAKVHTENCHSCGACLAACSESAIVEKPYLLGKITKYQTASGNLLTEGKLQVGSSMQSMLIKKLKEEAAHEDKITVFDAPPGTSCQVVQTLLGTDYIVLVTEPTPFGMHDLKIAVKVVKQLKIPFGVIVNKSGLGSDAIYDYLHKEKIDLLGKIPFSKAYAAKYSSGNILFDISEETAMIYRNIIKKIMMTA